MIILRSIRIGAIVAQARSERPQRPTGARALEAAAGVARAGADPHLVEDVRIFGLLFREERRPGCGAGNERHRLAAFLTPFLPDEAHFALRYLFLFERQTYRKSHRVILFIRNRNQYLTNPSHRSSLLCMAF